MMKQREAIALAILLLTTSKAFSQPTTPKPDFGAFIRQFPVVSLPDTVRFAEGEFVYAVYTPEGDSTANSGEAKVTASDKYQDHVLPKPDSLIIEYDAVSAFLLAKGEQTTVFREGGAPDAIEPVYYFSKKFPANKKFHVVVFERQYVVEGNQYSQKYLCTLNKNGKLIDKIKVASADYSGTGIMGDGFRIPWYPDAKSIVTKDLKILFFKEGINYIVSGETGKKELNADAVYQVETNGKIVKIH